MTTPTRFFALLLPFLVSPTIALTACVFIEPNEHEQAPTPAPQGGPDAGADAALDAADGSIDAGICTPLASWCAYTYVWPLSSYTYDTDVWGPQRCYCACTAHEDCATSSPASTCGTYLVPTDAGGLGPFFPGGWPLVCGYGMSSPITAQ